jgi:3-deoxy-D-manno-octulosonic-acid transferase
MTRNIYTLLLYLLLPFTPLKLLWRARSQPEYLQHWRERYGFYTLQMQHPVIWLHCVSVGETRATAPLVEALLQQFPDHQILLTHTTPTGRATSEALFSGSSFNNRVQRAYLPYDVPCAASRFLAHFKPVIGVLIETELWFNLIAHCKQKAIPLLLVNARLSEKSAHGYAKLGSLAQEGLQNLSAIAAQTEADAARFRALGAGVISVTGNLKFDVMPPQHTDEQGKLLRSFFNGHRNGSRPVLLAASTRDGEEAIILDAIASVQVPDLLTVIVPRHPQRFDEVEALLKNRNFKFVRRSSLSHKSVVEKETAYILGDSMGEMFSYYAACDVAFIGGSLLPFGGQNLIEACAVGKPVLIGPHTYNFALATELAITSGAAQRVKNSADLALAVKTLFTDEKKRQCMAAAALHFSEVSRGATTRTLSLLCTYL